MPTRVSVPEHVVYRSFVGETVALNLETGRYHGLNETAGHMLELLAELGDVDAAAHRLIAETGAPAGRVTSDLRDLCSSLAERGLIEVERAG